MSPDFQNGLAPQQKAFTVVAESRIEEPGVVGPQFPAGWLVGVHLGGEQGRDPHRLRRQQQVELLGFQDQSVLLFRVHRVPKIFDVMSPDGAQIQEKAVLLGLVSNDLIFVPVEVDA